MNLELWSSFVTLQIGTFTLGELMLSFAIVLLTVIIRGVLARTVFRRLKRLAALTKWKDDDLMLVALEKPLFTFLLLLGIYMAIAVLPLIPEWEELTRTVFRAVSVFIVFWALFRAADVLVDMLGHLPNADIANSYGGFSSLVKKSVRIFIVIIGVVMVIDNLGYNIAGIIATLGIGGAAFAFAAKDTIANLYGSVALALDHPFKVGDWIQVGDEVDGHVEEIGLRSTKVRTFSKTVVSIPNAILANEIIDNWSSMPKRRVKQVVGVTYETSPESMEKIVEGIRAILRNDKNVHQEFILVNWTDFGSNSLDILVYYFTTSIQWLEYMDVRQRINVLIAKLVSELGSSVAFPTRTLYLEGDIARKLAGGMDLPQDRGPQSPS